MARYLKLVGAKDYHNVKVGRVEKGGVGVLDDKDDVLAENMLDEEYKDSLNIYHPLFVEVNETEGLEIIRMKEEKAPEGRRAIRRAERQKEREMAGGSAPAPRARARSRRTATA